MAFLRRSIGWAPALVVGAGGAVAWAVFLSGSGMRSVLAWLALQTVLPVLAVVVALLLGAAAVWRRRADRRLWITLSLCAACAWPAAWLIGLGTFAFPFRLAAARPTATVRLPTEAPMRVVWGGDDLAHNRHASCPDQRWAYDLAVDPVLVGSERPEEYGCWGVPVVAPANGVVVEAHDGEPDETPSQPSGNVRAPLGNHVAIELPDAGGFLVIAHLQRGSVTATEGATIVEGSPIGRCGNSGNTSEPHVHVHLQRQDPRQRPVNFSEGLPLFFRDHDGPAMPRGGIAWIEGKARPTGDVIRHAAARPSEATRQAPR